MPSSWVVQTLLAGLRERFERGVIYTYIGSILVSVNPFTELPIYNPRFVEAYHNRKICSSGRAGRVAGDLLTCVLVAQLISRRICLPSPMPHIAR
jgi:hypothetical protein